MAKEEERKEDPIIPVGPGADTGDEQVVSEEDEQEAPESSETLGEESDERVGQSEEDGTDRTAIRARRREEKQRKREQRNRDITELRFLRQRNDSLERRQSQIEARVTQNDTLQIDSRINELDQKVREAENILSEAVSKGAGPEAAEAMRIRDQLRDGARELREIKTNQERQQQQIQRRPPPIDPEIAAQAQGWIRENSDWFDPTLRDVDSRVAKTIEDTLYAEGRFNPRTREYWDEYQRRLSRYMPNRFTKDGKRMNSRKEDDEDDDRDEDDSREGNGREEPRRTNRGGPRITTGGRERPLKKNEVYISSDRKAAMIEAGVWDDPVLRNKYLKRYQDYDREHGVRRH